MTEPAAVLACRKALMTAALHGDVEAMADLHRQLDHLTVLRRIPTQRSAACVDAEALAAVAAVVLDDGPLRPRNSGVAKAASPAPR